MTIRIRRSARIDGVALALSGELCGDDVVELDAVIEREELGGVVLDLTELTLVNRDGIDFIRRALAGGAEIVNCPHYIRRWIAEGVEEQDRA